MSFRAVPALAVCLIAVLPTAGCYQSEQSTVNVQGPTGNGTDIVVGGLEVQNVTLVTGPAGESGVASLVMTVVNDSDTADALVGLDTTPSSDASLNEPLAVAAGSVVPVGGPADDEILITGLTVEPGSYADVTFQFERSGSQTAQVAVVPAVGYYREWGPGGAAAAAAAPEPTEAEADADHAEPQDTGH